MLRDEISATVRRMAAEQLNLNVENVREDSRFADDLGCDSLDYVELTLQLEDEFEVSINDPDEDVEGDLTLKYFVDEIERALAEQTASAS